MIPSQTGQPDTLRRFEVAITLGTVLSLAWGAFAFGAVYPWAFAPLLIACLSVGLASFVPDVPGRRINRPLVFALVAVAAAGATQLVPLSPAILTWLSPATDRLLRQYDVNYANAIGISHPLSIDPMSTRRGLLFLGSFGVLLIGLARVLTPHQVVRLAGCVTGLGVTLALVAVIQRATFTTKIYGFWKPLDPNAGDPFGPFVNRNHFAGWMLMGLPLAIGLSCGVMARRVAGLGHGWRRRILWLSSPDGSRVLLVGFCTIAMALSLVLTMSRSGIGGFVAALVLTGWFAARRGVARSQRVITNAYLLFVAAVSVFWVGLDTVVTRFAAPLGRLPIWTDTWSIARDFPLTGTGLNTYGVATLFYQTRFTGPHLREAHNDYLQLAAEGGVLLGIPIAAAIVVLVREVHQKFQEASDDVTVYWIRVGAATGLVAIALQSIGEFSLQMPGNAALFTVLCAIAVHRPQAPRHLRSSHRQIRGSQTDLRVKEITP